MMYQSDPLETGCAFRDDGRYFVLAERHKSKDTVGVYDTSESYRLVRVRTIVVCASWPSVQSTSLYSTFPCQPLHSHPSHSPPMEIIWRLGKTRWRFAHDTNFSMLPVSANIMQYKLFVLSLSGLVVGSFTPDPDPGYGIRSVAWHPTGFFIAVGGYDDKVSLSHTLPPHSTYYVS